MMHVYIHIQVSLYIASDLTFSAVMCMKLRGESFEVRGSSFFLGKVTALGVLCCFALLFV